MSAPAFTRAPAISEAELIEIENRVAKAAHKLEQRAGRREDDPMGYWLLAAALREDSRRLIELVRRKEALWP
jgi:hypothetical protein